MGNFAIGMAGQDGVLKAVMNRLCICEIWSLWLSFCIIITILGFAPNNHPLRARNVRRLHEIASAKQLEL